MGININKWGVGQLNQATTLHGKKVYRRNKLFVMLGEMMEEVEVVYDPDHFLYQNQMPITKEEYNKYKSTIGYVPQSRLGSHVMCTCGDEGVVVVDPKAPPEWNNKLICKSVAQFGIHQTGMIIKDGKAELPENIAQDKIMTEKEYLESLKEDDK